MKMCMLRASEVLGVQFLQSVGCNKNFQVCFPPTPPQIRHSILAAKLQWGNMNQKSMIHFEFLWLE